MNHRIHASIALAVVAALGVATVSAPAAHARANPEVVPSLSCSFAEPFLQAFTSFEGLVLRERSETRKIPKSFAFRSAQVEIDAATHKRTGKVAYRFDAGDVIHVLEVIDKPSDPMMPLQYPKTASLDGQPGGCSEFPKGSVARVARPASGQGEITIRSKPKSSASVVATVEDDQVVFIQRGTGAWRKAWVQAYPAQNSGEVTTSNGWVRNKDISQGPMIPASKTTN